MLTAVPEKIESKLDEDSGRESEEKLYLQHARKNLHSFPQLCEEDENGGAFHMLEYSSTKLRHSMGSLLSIYC